MTQSGSATSYSRSGSTSGAFPDGTTASVSKSGSGSYDSSTGTGSYSGSSDVATRSGSTASTDTNLNYTKGESISGSTTVTKPDGSTATRTYGDGQAAASQGGSGAQRTTGSQAQTAAAPWQAKPSNGRYNPNELATATQSHQRSWNNLNQTFAKPAAPAGHGPGHAPKRGRRG